MKFDAKDALRDHNNPPVTCPNGHTHRLRRRFLARAIRHGRSIFCATCLTPFDV